MAARKPAAREPAAPGLAAREPAAREPAAREPAAGKSAGRRSAGPKPAGRKPALAEALRAWRDRVSPAAAGVPGGSDRRVPGLRREELADLAGLSVDYLVRLEQGRAAHPSPQVVEALARALRLTRDERDMLYQIAGAAPPAAGTVPRHVPAGVQRMTDRLGDTPVAVFTSSWTLIRCNALWAALLGDFSGLAGRDRNLIWRHFTGGWSRVQRDAAETASFEREMVADLHVACGKYPDDRELGELIDALLPASESFAALWGHFEMAPRAAERKTIVHPLVGPVTLDCDILTVAASDLRLVVYTAEPDSPDAVKLDLVRVAGLQDLRP